MGQRLLPKAGTKEAQELIAEYEVCSYARLKELAKELGYASVNSFESSMFKLLDARRKVPTGSIAPREEEQTPIIKLLPVELKAYKATKRGRGDPETQVLLLGDHHAGEITSTYTPDVYKKRLNEAYQSTLTITETHRHSFPINDLVIIALGDMVHGENPRQGAKIGTVACGAVEQVYDLALPELLNFIISLRQEFRSIKFYGVWGNHGRASLEAPETSNWDNMLYKALKTARLPKGIEIYPPSDFYQMVNIKGFGFFCYHGDQIKISSGIPYFAQRRKLMSWYITFGGFAYACQGHTHTDDRLTISAKSVLFTNGSLVSDDPFALRVVGTSSFPIQRTFGVHERIGVTWENKVIVDYSFLPPKALEKEQLK